MRYALPAPYGSGMSLASDREELAAVVRQIKELADTGQSYSLVGGHAVTHAGIEELSILRDRIRARIMRRKGYHGRVW